jgi:hypothetical protein
MTCCSREKRIDGGPSKGKGEYDALNERTIARAEEKRQRNTPDSIAKTWFPTASYVCSGFSREMRNR